MSKINTQVEQVTIELHPLPEKWVWSSLGDIGLVQLGKTPRKSDYRNSGEYKIIKFRDIEKSGNIDWDKEDKGYVDSSDEIRSTLKKLENFDVLVTASAHMSEHIGKKVGIVITIPSKYKEAYVVGEILQIRTNKETEPKWVLYYLGSSEGYKAIQRRVHGVHLIASRARNIEIPLAPPEQQIQIVAEIEKQFSRLDEAVANLKRVKANLKRYKAAVLKAAVEGKLTEEWRKAHPDVEPADKLLERILTERRKKWEQTELAKIKAKGKIPKDNKWKKKYKEPTGPNLEEIGNLPKKWTWGTWDQISNWVTYGFTRPMPHVDEGAPIVTAKHVKNGKIDFVNTHKTPQENYENLSDKDRPEPNDILITKDGTIGRVAIVPEHNGFCINQSVAVIWLRSCPIKRKFLLAIIDSDLTQKPILVKARGVAIQHLSITDFAKLTIPIPPLDEQDELVSVTESKLSVIEEIDSIVDSNLKRAERLRQSILSKAFSGNLITAQENIDSESNLKKLVG